MHGLVWNVLLLLVTGAVVAEALILMGVMRQLGTVLLHIRPGAPHEVGGGPEVGAILDAPGLDVGGGTVVLFIAPGCEPCANLLPSVPVVQNNHRDVQLVAVVGYGDEDARAAYANSVGPFARADLADLYSEWQIPGTPFALSIDRDRRLRLKGIVNTLEQLTVMAEAAKQPAPGDERIAASRNGHRENLSSAEAAAVGLKAD